MCEVGRRFLIEVAFEQRESGINKNEGRRGTKGVNDFVAPSTSPSSY